MVVGGDRFHGGLGMSSEKRHVDVNLSPFKESIANSFWFGNLVVAAGQSSISSNKVVGTEVKRYSKVT